MKLETKADTLHVTGVRELGATNANEFRDWVRAGLSSEHKHIEVDLSQTSFVDSCGLGALVALHKTACSRSGSLRLLNPQAGVKQILDLTRLSRIFEITRS